MGTLEVIDDLPETRARRFDVRVLAAFFAIYFLWGATFLAIRVAVLEIPPFFTAGLRFFTVYGPWYRPDMAEHAAVPDDDRSGESVDRAKDLSR